MNKEEITQLRKEILEIPLSEFNEEPECREIYIIREKLKIYGENVKCIDNSVYQQQLCYKKGQFFDITDSHFKTSEWMDITDNICVKVFPNNEKCIRYMGKNEKGENIIKKLLQERGDTTMSKCDMGTCDWCDSVVKESELIDGVCSFCHEHLTKAEKNE